MDVVFYTNLLKENTLAVVFATAFLIIVTFFWSIKRGNITILYLLNRVGIMAYSAKIDTDYKLVNKLNKDCVAWLSVPNTVYAPVMGMCKEYKGKNYLGRESSYGEIGISEDKVSTFFKSFALNTDGVGDLTIIEGRDYVRNARIRNGQFTLLENYTKTDLCINKPIIELVDSIGKHNYKYIGRLEYGLNEKKNFAVKDRDSLVDLLYLLTGSKLKPVYDKKILLLKTSSGIDVSYVVLQEMG